MNGSHPRVEFRFQASKAEFPFLLVKHGYEFWKGESWI